LIGLPVVALALVGCSTGMSPTDYDKLTAEITKASFQDKNLVKVDRLVQDDVMAACSAAEVAGKPLDEKAAKAIQDAAHENHQMAVRR
jgi:sulfur-oxidizing protein SoxX